MKHLCAVVLALLGSSLAADDQPAACVPTSYRAASISVIYGMPSVSYHDLEKGLALYENLPSTGGGSELWDFNEGVLYIKLPNGTCLKWENSTILLTHHHPDMEDPAVPLMFYNDTHGIRRHGYEIPVENTQTSELELEDCDRTFLAFYLNGHPWRMTHNFDFTPLTDDDKKFIQDAKKDFKTSNCEAQKMK